MPAARKMTGNHFRRSVDGTKVVANDLKRVSAQLLAARLVGEELAQDLFQLRRVPHLHRALLRHEVADDFRKVLHMGAKDHGFAQRARFNRVLAAFSGKALADVNDRRVLVEVFQLASGIDQQAVDLTRLKPGVGRKFAAIQTGTTPRTIRYYEEIGLL